MTLSKSGVLRVVLNREVEIPSALFITGKYSSRLPLLKGPLKLNSR